MDLPIDTIKTECTAVRAGDDLYNALKWIRPSDTVATEWFGLYIHDRQFILRGTTYSMGSFKIRQSMRTGKTVIDHDLMALNTVLIFP